MGRTRYFLLVSLVSIISAFFPSANPSALSPSTQIGQGESHPFKAAHKAASSYIRELFRDAAAKGAFNALTDPERNQILSALLTHPLTNEHLAVNQDVVDVVAYLEWVAKERKEPYRLVRNRLINRCIVHEEMERLLRARIHYEAFESLLHRYLGKEIRFLNDLVKEEYGYELASRDPAQRQLALFHRIIFWQKKQRMAP